MSDHENEILEDCFANDNWVGDYGDKHFTRRQPYARPNGAEGATFRFDK